MFDQQCVNKVSRRFSLPLFLLLVFRVQLADIFFFRLPVCECPSALSQLNFWSSVSTVRVLFHWKHCLYLNCCFAIRDSFSVCNLVPRVLSYPPYEAREGETLENAGHVAPEQN